MLVFMALNNLLSHLFHFFADLAQDFVALGHKSAGFLGLGEAIAILFYSLADFFNGISLVFLDLVNVAHDGAGLYLSWTDGTMLHELFQSVMLIFVDEYGEPSEWLQREITDLSPMLGRAIFEEQNNYGLTFWDQLYNVMLFFYEPGRIVPYLVGLYNLEWRRLFDDPLGWLLDRLTELGFILPAWLDDPVAWLWNQLLEWGLTESWFPDDILAWLWEWLLSTAADTFERIAAPFQILASKMLRYLIEGVFEA